jgi:hemerythrin
MEWSEALELGVERMDATHREFVEQLNTLGEASDAAMLAGLDAFISHTEAHFGQERDWMTDGIYGHAHCHLQEHDGVLGIMREVRGMVADGQFELGRVLVRELAPWFANHAATMDAMLALYLQGGATTGKCGSCAEPGHEHAHEHEHEHE